MITYCGTPLNMAPEIMHRRSYTYKADIWALGVLIFYLITGCYPFFAKGRQQLLMNLDNGEYRLNKEIKITPICLDFINKCLQYNPDKRFDWITIEQHPFYKAKEYYRLFEKLSFALSVEESGHYQLSSKSKNLPERSACLQSVGYQ